MKFTRTDNNYKLKWTRVISYLGYCINTIDPSVLSDNMVSELQKLSSNDNDSLYSFTPHIVQLRKFNISSKF